METRGFPGTFQLQLHVVLWKEMLHELRMVHHAVPVLKTPWGLQPALFLGVALGFAWGLVDWDGWGMVTFTCTSTAIYLHTPTCASRLPCTSHFHRYLQNPTCGICTTYMPTGPMRDYGETMTKLGRPLGETGSTAGREYGKKGPDLGETSAKPWRHLNLIQPSRVISDLTLRVISDDLSLTGSPFRFRIGL